MGLYARDIQWCLTRIFQGLTPFVYAEARGGFADYVVYINEENLSVWAQRTIGCGGMSPPFCCPHYNRVTDTCMDSDTCMTMASRGGSRDMEHSTSYPEKRCMGIKCGRYHRILHERSYLKKRLPGGLHLLEIKTDRDSLKRFGYQLPHYCLFGDYVWLILETHKIPPWVPPFVGVMRFSQGALSIEKDPMKITRVPPLNPRVIRSQNPGVSQVGDCDLFLRFLRAWFINSIFYSVTGGHNIIDMPAVEDLLCLQKKQPCVTSPETAYPTLGEF